MSEQPGLMQDAIAAAIDEHLPALGGGLRLAYIYAIDVIDAEGNSVRYLGSPHQQEPYRSIGLTEYLRKYLDLEATDEIAAANGCSGCADCGDDD